MKGGDCGLEIGVGEDEAEIEERCALRNHADVDRAEDLEGAAGYAGSVADVFANEADESLAGFNRDVCE